MVTRNKHDIIRERRLAKKLDRVATEWTPQGDKSWQRFTRCKLCQERYCVNNHADRKVRTHRVLGVAVCPNCFYRRGTERLVRIYKLGKELSQFTPDPYEPELMYSELEEFVKRAKEIFDE